jgi:hypothetical protein
VARWRRTALDEGHLRQAPGFSIGHGPLEGLWNPGMNCACSPFLPAGG